MTCEEALDFVKRADDLWHAWIAAADTEDAEKREEACESYIIAMEELRVEFGHPPGRPRRPR